MTHTVYIIRGLPGSGKSTIANQLRIAALSLGLSVAVHTTDDYFEAEGKYEWTPEKSKKYHERNYKAFCKSLEQGTNVVICPNTNLNQSQYQKYEDAAKPYGYRLVRIIMDDFNVARCHCRTKHKVPKETIRKMAQAFEIQYLNKKELQ